MVFITVSSSLKNSENLMLVFFLFKNHNLMKLIITLLNRDYLFKYYEIVHI